MTQEPDEGGEIAILVKNRAAAIMARLTPSVASQVGNWREPVRKKRLRGAGLPGADLDGYEGSRMIRNVKVGCKRSFRGPAS